MNAGLIQNQEKIMKAKFFQIYLFAILFAVFAATLAGAQQMRQTAMPNQQISLTESTVNRLIDLFEFALAGRFSPQQREEFKRLLAAQWQANDVKAIGSYQQLLDIYDKLSALDNEKLREMQAQLQTALLSELKKNPNGGYNPLLINVYNKAHGGIIESNAGNFNNQTSVRSSGGSVPVELIGKWQAGSSSSTGYTNSATGATTSGGGTQVIYTFFPDGRFEYASLYILTTYNCTTDTMLYKTGRIELDGATLTLVTESGKFTSRDNCNRQYNYEKPAKLDRETFKWFVTRDEYGTKLCLQNPGINGCAYKRD